MSDFFVFRFSLLFGAFFFSFPRILGLGVPRREKPLLFSGFPLLVFQKSKGWRVRVSTKERKRKSAKERKRAQKGAKELFCLKIANNQV